MAELSSSEPTAAREQLYTGDSVSDERSLTFEIAFAHIDVRHELAHRLAAPVTAALSTVPWPHYDSMFAYLVATPAADADHDNA